MSKAAKKILSLTLALMLTVGMTLGATPMTVSAETVEQPAVETTVDPPAEDPAPPSQPEAEQAEVLPNLDNLETPIEVPEGRTLLTGRNTTSRTVSTRGSEMIALYDNPNLAPPTPSPAGARSFSASRFATNTPVGGVVSILNHDTGSSMSVQLAAKGTYCDIYVHTDSSYSPMNVNFQPQGAAANAMATEIASEFDSNIWPLLTGSRIGYGIRPFHGDKVKIVLYAIDGDSGAMSGTYTAGFVAPNDIISNNPAISNEDNVLYIDITTNGGYANFTGTSITKKSFFGTIAHEFQHMLNSSEWMRNFRAGRTNPYGDPSDPDYDGYAMMTTTWLDEGISGFVDVAYAGFMPPSHLSFFLDDWFAPGVGYVPTAAQWRSASGGVEVLANYGAASVLIQEYAASYGSSLNKLASFPVYGYNGSKRSIMNGIIGSENSYYEENFNKFFEFAMLAVGVDTPYSTIAAIEADNKIAYTSPFSGINYWDIRDVGSNAYAGVTPIDDTMASVSTNSNGREYYSQLFLADNIGGTKNAVTINLNSTSGASYYVITPFNATQIDTNSKWNNVGKITGQLVNGVNTVTVGTNNRFAILAINTDSSISGDNFSYTTGVDTSVAGTFTLGAPVVTPNPLTPNVAGQTVTLDVTTNLVDGSVLTAQVVKHDDHSAVVGFDAAVGTTVTNGQATLSFTTNANLAEGGYRISVSDGTATPVYSDRIVAGSMYAVNVLNGSASPDLALLGETITITAATQQGLAFKEWVTADPGVSFADKDSKTTTFTMPGNNVDVAAVFTGDGTAPVDPTIMDVSPKSFNLDLRYTGTASMHVSLGMSGNSLSTPQCAKAVITSDNPNVIVTPSEVTSSGTVKIQATQIGNATLTVSFLDASGADARTPIDVPIAVQHSDDNIWAWSTDSGSSGNGGSGSGGGSGRNQDTGVPATRTPETKINEVTASDAKTLAKDAKDKGQEYVRTRSTQTTTVSKDAMQAFKGMSYQHDTVLDGVVQVRVTIPHPEKVTSTLSVSGRISSETITKIKTLFGKYFSNKVSVIYLDQKGSYGQAVNVAAKVNLAGMNTKNLCLYTFDTTTQTYKLLKNTAYTIDSNGYLCFSTELGGAIIVSDGALAGK